ncbi:hypothetical protein K1X84_01075 [bacterium]|nr:hypothetical protein [bacterium]
MITLLKKTNLLMLLLGLSLYGISCSDNNDSLTVDEASIQEEIETDADEIYGVDIMNEEDPSNFATIASGSETLAKSLSAIEPVAYGRRLRHARIVRDRLDVQVSDDGMTATATIRYLLRGQFVIRTRDTNNNVRGFYFKPLVHKMERKIRFVRNPDTTAVQRWIRDGITPAYGISDGGTLSLTGNINIYVTHDGNTETYTIGDPLNYFFTDQTSLPTVQPGDQVRIEIAIANSNTDDAPYGIVHRGRNKAHLGRAKNIFNDEGVDGDAVSGDGVYTVEWTVENNGVTGNHIGVIDFFTHSTVFDSEAPYNSLVVALPYNKVQ